MGTKYEMPSHAFEDEPTHVEGLRLWTTYCEKTSHVKTVCITVEYWDGAESLGKRLIQLYKCRILDNGGAESDWSSIVALAANPSDIDDVIEAMTESGWGAKVLWGCWRGIQGQ